MTDTPARNLARRIVHGLPFQFCAVLLIFQLMRWKLQFLNIDYTASILSVEALTNWRFLILLAVVVGPLILLRKRITWTLIDERRRTRTFVFTVSAALVWACVTWRYNSLLDQGYVFDRLLLLLLLGLVWRHPLFVPVLTLQLVLFIGQLHFVPWAGMHWADKWLPLSVLFLFSAFLYMRAATTHTKPYLFLMLTLCVVGVSYGSAALDKLEVGPEWSSWVMDNNLSNLFVSSYKSGWLRFLGDERALEWAGSLSKVERLITWGTLFVEAAGFAILVGPRISKLTLLAVIGMHVGIVLTSGIFFWKWVILDAALLYYLHRFHMDSQAAQTPSEGEQPASEVELGAEAARRPACRGLYALTNVVLALLVMVFGRTYLHSGKYSWFDSRFMNHYTLLGVGSSGQHYPIDPRFFAPYDMVLQQSRFFYLMEGPVISGTYGVVYDHELMLKLETATPTQIDGLRERYGRMWRDPKVERDFEVFLERSVSTAVDRGPRPWLLALVAAPFHFQTMEREDAYRFQEELVRVDVVFEEYLRQDTGIVPISSKTVLTVWLDERARLLGK